MAPVPQELLQHDPFTPQPQRHASGGGRPFGVWHLPSGKELESEKNARAINTVIAIGAAVAPMFFLDTASAAPALAYGFLTGMGIRRAFRNARESFKSGHYLWGMVNLAAGSIGTIVLAGSEVVLSHIYPPACIEIAAGAAAGFLIEPKLPLA